MSDEDNLATMRATEKTLRGVLAAAGGGGLPIPMTFADPGSDAYTAAQAAARDCTRVRLVVNASGVVISLDNGATASITMPPGSMDDIPVAIPAGTLIKVKRFSAGVAFTGLSVEVR